jgi:outer membrane protein assembly factor BamD
MSLSSAFPLRAFCALIAFGLLGSLARADLVWSPQTGWSVEGGVLAGMDRRDSGNALSLMNAARQSEEAGSNHSALKKYTLVTKKYSNSVYAPEAFYRIAQIRMKQKDLSKAFIAYQQIIARYPNVKRFNEIIENMYQIAAATVNGARGRFLWIFPGFPNRERGIGYLLTIVNDAPYHDYAGLALMEAARTMEYLGDNDEAIETLDQFINSYPQNPFTPDAYLRLAKAHATLVAGAAYDQAETKQAITYDEDFMILFPSDPKIGDAAQGLDTMKKMLAESKMRIGDFYFYKRDNYPAARVFYNEAITSYPGSDVAKRARVRLNEVEAKANAAARPGPAPKKHFLFF